MTTFEAKVTSKGQITVPARLRSHLRLAPGDKVVFVKRSDGSISVEAKTHGFADLRGIVDRAGAAVGQGDMERWLEEARGARWRRFREQSAVKAKKPR